MFWTLIFFFIYTLALWYFKCKAISLMMPLWLNARQQNLNCVFSSQRNLTVCILLNYSCL